MNGVRTRGDILVGLAKLCVFPVIVSLWLIGWKLYDLQLQKMSVLVREQKRF